MTATPVSILMPAYNGARYLREAVDSVLAQTHRDFELLAIDDGSTDDTLEILRGYAARDSRVRVISHANKGMGRALNDAMDLARHEWVARIDADDVMLPHRLERQVAFLAEHPTLVLASSLVHYIDESSTVVGKSRNDYTDPARVAEDVRDHVLIGFHHPAVIVRKDVVKAAGGYRPAYWPADDLDLWNRIAELPLPAPGPHILVQGEYLVNYRIHGHSVCVEKSRLTTQKVEWVTACMRCRRTGQPEPTWEAYLDEQRRLPWALRLNNTRKDHARTMYKAAVLHFSRKHYARFIPPLVVAAILEPTYVFHKLAPQLGM